MITVAPLKLSGVFRVSAFVLFGLTLAWGAISLVIFGDILVNQWLAAIFLLMAALGGVFLYQRNYRLKLQYDAHGFALFTGRTKVAAGQWKHFNRVSLFHRGYAMFAVRLYTPEKSYVDIPVSELKLDPDSFRQIVIPLVEQNQPAAASE